MLLSTTLRRSSPDIINHPLKLFSLVTHFFSFHSLELHKALCRRRHHHHHQNLGKPKNLFRSHQSPLLSFCSSPSSVADHDSTTGGPERKYKHASPHPAVTSGIKHAHGQWNSSFLLKPRTPNILAAFVTALQKHTIPPFFTYSHPPHPSIYRTINVQQCVTVCSGMQQGEKIKTATKKL